MDVDIQRFLADEGFRDEAAAQARALLKAFGLTRAGKRRLLAPLLGLAC